VVFQDLKILMDRTIFENVILPLQVAGVKEKLAEQKVQEVLEKVGVIDHKDKFPVQLSGGQLQRTAIARALVMSPPILLADEPTGNLDIETAFEIVALLQEINKQGTTIIMATHNKEIVDKNKKRIVTLHKGRLVKDESPSKNEEKKGGSKKINDS